MNLSAVLATITTITTTAVAATVLMLPAAAQEADRLAVHCAQAWRLDPAGRHWLMATRLGRDDQCPGERLLERARQLEHDPLR